MYVNIGKTSNNVFHADMINRRFDRNTVAGEEKSGVFMRQDIATISQKGKSMSAVERLMNQKNFIIECKEAVLERMADEESGYCSADIKKKMEEYEKQLESIDKQIAEEMAKEATGAEKTEKNGIYKKTSPVTKQEAENRRLANITKLSAESGQSTVIDSVKNRLQGEKHVLEAELKMSDSGIKRQRIAEIDDRTEELTKASFAKMGEIINQNADDTKETVYAKEEDENEEDKKGTA